MSGRKETFKEFEGLLARFRHNCMKNMGFSDTHYPDGKVWPFWIKWSKAGELERVDHIKTLFKDCRLCEDDLDVHALSSLVNSYLEDLEETMKTMYFKQLEDLTKIVKGELVKL